MKKFIQLCLSIITFVCFVIVIAGCNIISLKSSNINDQQKDQLFSKYFDKNDVKSASCNEIVTWNQLMENKEFFKYSQIVELEITNRIIKDYDYSTNGTGYFNAKILKSYYGTLLKDDQIILEQTIGDDIYKIPNFPLYTDGEKMIVILNSYSNICADYEKEYSSKYPNKVDWEFYIPIIQPVIGFIDNINGEEYVKFDEVGDFNATDELKRLNIINNDDEVLHLQKDENKLTYVKKDIFEKFIEKKQDYEKAYEASSK
jgi:hypothetical protein